MVVQLTTDSILNSLNPVGIPYLMLDYVIACLEAQGIKVKLRNY